MLGRPVDKKSDGIRWGGGGRTGRRARVRKGFLESGEA